MAKSCSRLDEARFARYYTDYGCHNTIQHWQLRDLVAFDDTTNCIYTACGAKIVSFNLRTKVVCDVAQSPPRGHRGPSGATTFSVQGGYLATGTDKGELSVFEIENGSPLKVKSRFQSTITRQNEVLNHLNVIASSGRHPRLYCCGNDRTVRCFDLLNMRCLEEIKQPVAVNCSAEDPSGRYLITLGDDNKVHMYSRDQTGMMRETGQLSADFTESNTVNACGMCVNWHPWGNCFATGFQCGQLLVWDVRTNQRVVQLRANRAVRTVKYSSEPNDLLAFAEHEQSFHLVDARNYSAQQRLNVSVSNVGISGLAFDSNGSRLYVGVDCKGFQEWRIDSACRRSFSCASPA